MGAALSILLKGQVGGGGITLPCYLTSGRYFTVKVTSSCVPDLSLAAAGFPKVTENISAVEDKMKRKDLI